jgi:hypothetical protein
MIKLQNGLVIMPQFMESFNKLMGMEMSAKQCLELSTAQEEIVSQVTIVNRSKKVILEKYCLKNEEGNPILDEGNATFETLEVQEKCLGDIAEVMNEFFELHVENKVVVDEDTKMTPQDFTLLKDLIEIKEKE